MRFGFFGKNTALIVGCSAIILLMPNMIGSLRDHLTLLSSLTAYSASAIVCTALTLLNRKTTFNFDGINKKGIELYDLSQQVK